MNRLVQRFGVRGVIIVAALALAGVAAFAAALTGKDGQTAQSPGPVTATAPSVSPTPAVTGHSPILVSPTDDGQEQPQPSYSPPSLKAGQPDAREAATQFAAAWLNTQNKTPAQWRAAIIPRSTPRLAGLLEDADPASVPAGRIGGQVQVSTVGDGLAEATMPVVSSLNTLVGTLTLGLQASNGRWLVSSINWAPA